MDKTLLGLLMLFFLAFIIFITFVVFNDQLTSVTRASTDVISPEKTYTFAWPLTVEADGKSESEITIFVRNDEGKGISGKTVRLSSPVGKIKEPSLVTDAAGRVAFRISSSNPGLAEIEVVVDNNPIRNNVSIQFR